MTMLRKALHPSLSIITDFFHMAELQIIKSLAVMKTKVIMKGQGN